MKFDVLVMVAVGCYCSSCWRCAVDAVNGVDRGLWQMAGSSVAVGEPVTELPLGEASGFGVLLDR